MQRKIGVSIVGDKDIEDHVTQWQEFITIKQGHGAGEIEERQCQQNSALVNRFWVGRSWQVCHGGLKEMKPATLIPSHSHTFKSESLTQMKRT